MKNHSFVSFPFFVLLVMVAVTSLFIPTANAMWLKTLNAEFMVHPDPISEPVMLQAQVGTSIIMSLTADRLQDEVALPSDNGNLSQYSGIEGSVCVKNTGNLATQGITITIQMKTDFASEAANPTKSELIIYYPDKQIEPGETICNPYLFNSEKNYAKAILVTALATITNHSGWISGTDNCPGSEACPFGAETSVTLEEIIAATPVVTETTIPTLSPNTLPDVLPTEKPLPPVTVNPTLPTEVTPLPTESVEPIAPTEETPLPTEFVDPVTPTEEAPVPTEVVETEPPAATEEPAPPPEVTEEPPSDPPPVE